MLGDWAWLQQAMVPHQPALKVAIQARILVLMVLTMPCTARQTAAGQPPVS